MTSRWRSLRIIAGYAVALAAILATVSFLDLDWQSFRFHVNKIPGSAILLAALMFLAHTVINAAAFGVLLRAFNPSASVRESAASWLSTMLAKYIPGGVWHFLSRGVLLHRAGVTKQDIFFSGALEQAISISSAFTIALLLVAWNSSSWLYVGILAASMITGGLIVLGARAKISGAVDRETFLRSCFLYTISMIPYAAGYVLIVQPDRLLDFLGWLFVATSGGMAALITPGGLGVREAILSAPADPVDGQAIFAAVMAVRVTIILTEALASSGAILLSMMNGGKRKAPTKRPKIGSTGYGVQGPGYPNSRSVQKIFDSLEAWHHVDATRWLPENVHLWRILKARDLSGLFVLTRLAMGSLGQLVMALPGRARMNFVPYPSIFLLWWSSWIPARFRPRFIADAYISIWDSAFNDRIRDTGKPSLASRLLRSFEGRALKAATAVIVDTTANRCWMADEFGLDHARIHAFPLAFEANPFLKVPALRAVDYEQDDFRILFFGTLVPLQGIKVICEAIEQLKGHRRIQFLVVGDGQEAWRMEQLMVSPDISTVRWIRKWASPAELAGHLSGAHLSLGVFGGSGKAERVLPWKIYLALAAGRPVLTQSAFSLPSDVDHPPLLHSEPTGKSLAAAILSASRRGDELAECAKASRTYFLENLAESCIRSRWQNLLENVSGGSPKPERGQSHAVRRNRDSSAQ